MKTKGIINILPDKVQMNILPHVEEEEEEVKLEKTSLDLEKIGNKNKEDEDKENDEYNDNIIYLMNGGKISKKMMLRSVVLQSSQKLKRESKKKFQSPSEFKWDNMEKYKKIYSNKDKKGKSDFIKILKAHIYKQIFNKVKTSTIYKSASIFSIILIIQLLISKRMRNYSSSFFKVFVYLLTSGLSTYSIYSIYKEYTRSSPNINNDEKRKKKINKLQTLSNKSVLNRRISVFGSGSDSNYDEIEENNEERIQVLNKEFDEEI
jgi:hypothetical protein